MIAKKKIARSVAATVAAAAAFTVVMPAGSAFAIDHVTCMNGENFLKIWSHLADGTRSVDCYANAGTTQFSNPFDARDRWWVDEIYTGNNDLRYEDANGAKVDVPRWNDIRYPNRPPQVFMITIR